MKRAVRERERREGGARDARRRAGRRGGRRGFFVDSECGPVEGSVREGEVRRRRRGRRARAGRLRAGSSEGAGEEVEPVPVEEAEAPLEAHERDGAGARLGVVVRERVDGGGGDAVARVEDDRAEVREPRDARRDGGVGDARAGQIERRAPRRERGEGREHRLRLRLRAAVAAGQRLRVHAHAQRRARYRAAKPRRGARQRRHVPGGELREHELEDALLQRVQRARAVPRGDGERRRHRRGRVWGEGRPDPRNLSGLEHS